MAEEGGRIPMSPGLQATLLRARDYAASQSQPQVVLEHLLLALTEDADATHVLEASGIDIGRLRNDVAGFIGAIQERSAPGTPGSPAISPALTQVLKYATLAAQQGRRASIDGAIVLAALIGDGRSMAASFLKAQGLTFEAAIKALREATARPATQAPATQPPAAQPPAPQQPAPRTPDPYSPDSYSASATTPRAEDMLAAARERVVSRTSQTTRTSPPREPQPATSAPLPPAASQQATRPAPEAVAQPVPQHQPLPEAEPRLAPVPDRAATVPPAPASAQPSPPPASVPSIEPPPVRAESFPSPARPAARQSHPLNLQLPPPSAWSPPPSAPPAPGLPSYRPSAPAPPAGWTGRPPAQDSLAPGRAPALERQPPTGAPWPEPAQQRHHEQRLPPTEPQRPITTPPAPGPGTTGALVAPSRGPAIDPAQIAHTIPTRLTMGRAHVLEIRIERPPLAGGGGGQRPHALRSETVVARAIAVRLRPLAGRLIVDAVSPETQWDQGGGGGDAGRFASEAAIWRFTVTPLAIGRGVLQLAVTARTMGADGVLAETQLPDQAFEVRAAPNVQSMLARLGKYALVSISSMVLIEVIEALLGVEFLALVLQALR